MTNSTGSGHAERLRQDAASELASIGALVADAMGEVEVAFCDNLSSTVEIVDEIGTFVSDGGGKRLRPMLHLLCARLCGYRGPHAVTLATVLEYIHCATLIHDDIIDEARTRRGRPSVNAGWGNNITVLFGDHLLAKAMELALRAKSLRVMEMLAEVTLRMTEGEMLQTRYVGRLDLTEREYLDLVERKTAALFACCCELAGEVAGVPAAEAEGLARYGRNLGMAFQIVDDVLDFMGNSATLGKPSASDLREGKATLPVIDWLGGSRPGARRLVERAMRSPRADSPEIAELTSALLEHGAIERSYERAERYASAAQAELAAFSDGAFRDALATLPELLVHRDR